MDPSCAACAACAACVLVLWRVAPPLVRPTAYTRSYPTLYYSPQVPQAVAQKHYLQYVRTKMRSSAQQSPVHFSLGGLHATRFVK